MNSGKKILKEQKNNDKINNTNNNKDNKNRENREKAEKKDAGQLHGQGVGKETGLRDGQRKMEPSG